MNIALQIKNQELSGYWFRIQAYEAPPAGWTLPVKDVGYIAPDGTWNGLYSPYRTKPTSIAAGRLTEMVNIAVKAYYDGTYTSFYSEANFTARFHFIDRTSSVWTRLYNNTFDDGTAQGWGASGISGTYYRSYPYSLYLSTGGSEAAFSKSFEVETIYSEAYLIFSIRSSNWPGSTRINLDGVTYFMPDVVPSANIWYQFTIPIPTAPPVVTSVEIWAASYSQAYLDDAFVIARQ